MKRLAFVFALLSSPLHAAGFDFCWQGSGGYTMEGRITFRDALLNTGIITENDIDGLLIRGYLNGQPIGSWNSKDRGPFDTFTLSFDTDNLEFPMGATPGGNNYQAWNADGTASNCGVPGFGFNAGSNAQDVCVNGAWMTESMVDRYTPLPVYPLRQAPGCGPQATS